MPGTTAGCSARRLLASSCVSGRCLAPGWHWETGRDFLAFDAGSQRCLAPGWQQFASIRARFAKVPGANGTARMAFQVRLATGCRRQATPDGCQPMLAVGRSHEARQPVCGVKALAEGHFRRFRTKKPYTKHQQQVPGTTDPADLAIGSRTNDRSRVKMRFGRRSPSRHTLSLSANRNGPSRWRFSVLSANKDLLVVFVPFVPSTGLAGCH